MYGGSIGDCLVGVDASVWLLSIEVFFEELLDLGDSSGSSDEHDLIDLTALEPRVIHSLLDRLEGILEEIVAELLKFSTCECLFEVNTVDKVLNENGHLLDAR